MIEEIIRKQTIVLMAGLPGSGKTTLATLLEQKLGWELINKDFIKACFMYEGLSDEDAAWHAYETSFRKVAAALREEKRSIILDSSSLPFFVHKRAIELANSTGINLKVLYCVVENNETLRKQRLFQRNALISQQNARTLTMGSDPAQFAHLWPILIQTIDTNMPPEKCLETALDLCGTQDKAYSIYSTISPVQMLRSNKTVLPNQSLMPYPGAIWSQQQNLLYPAEEGSDFQKAA